MHRTHHPFLCPVKAWEATVQSICTYPGFFPSWPVNTLHNGISRTGIKRLSFLTAIRMAVRALGKDNLRFEYHEVGTHSNRSSTVMLMYLDRIPMYTIMLVG